MKPKAAITTILLALGIIVVSYWLIISTKNETLQEFQIVSDGMREYNIVRDKASNHYLDSLQHIYEEYPEITQPYYHDAHLASGILDELIAYIEAIRQLLIEVSGGYVNDDAAAGNLKGKRNYDVTTRLMVDQRRGDSLQHKIMETREHLLALDIWTEEDVAFFEKSITLNAEFDSTMKVAAKKLGKRSWAEYHFDHVPVIAANTILQKFQGDAKNTRILMIDRLYDKAKVAVAETAQ